VSTLPEKQSTAKSLIALSDSQPVGLSVTNKFNSADGQTTRSHIKFAVQHEGYWFAVHADQQGSFAVFRIHAILGRLPFTFQSAFARTCIMTVVRAACRHLNARYRTDAQQRILLIHETRSKGVLNPKRILTETTKVLLQLKPYLELITTLQPPKHPDSADVKTNEDTDVEIEMEDFSIKDPAQQ
jgi:hypothetical protein